MPKKDWLSKSRNLLPDDKHFNSKSLLKLFLKPKARLGSRRRTDFGNRGVFGNAGQENQPEGEMDEAFWAQQKAPMHETEDTALPGGDYDANFFQDDGLPFQGDDGDDDDMEFADAREHFSPVVEGEGGVTETGGITRLLGGDTVTNTMTGAFGTTLVTQTRRVRPEYVQYARVAKKVDVRRLKEEIWKGMDLDSLEVSTVFLHTAKQSGNLLLDSRTGNRQHPLHSSVLTISRRNPPTKTQLQTPRPRNHSSSPRS
jgi:condensin complex subunit 2